MSRRIRTARPVKALVSRLDAHISGIIDDRLAGMQGQLTKLQASVTRSTPRWGPGAEPVTLDYSRAKILLTPTTKLARNRSRASAKEPFTVTWLENTLRSGDVLYDIGANVGAYALIAGRQAGGKLQVYAFEPAFSTYATLYENVVLNRAGAVVQPLQVLLGARTEVSAIHLRDLRAGAAQHDVDDDTPYGETGYDQPVLAYRLDDLVAAGLPAPTHMKLDVDGAELSVLEGAPNVLGDPALRSLMIEVSERRAADIAELLEGHGFAETERHERQEGEAAFWYAQFAR